MLNERSFREIVSGRRRGAAAMLARGVLRLAEVPYAAAVGWRNWRFDRAHGAVERVDVPVVSVGNLTLGGTGKTPMVKWLAGWFAEQGVRVAVVSRGYGAVSDGKNDEALELEQALPGVPHLQNADRVAGTEQAIRQFDSQAIVLDDGFQHRRLARDLDIVLLDASAPFGFEHVFPRGMLRESIEGLDRAQVVCLTRADSISPAEREAIRIRVASLAPQAAWCEAIHAPAKLQNAAAETLSIESLTRRRIGAFCAIGNPAAFRRTLEAQDAHLVYWREFPDHHTYARAECDELANAVETSGAELAVVTHKDLVKLPFEKLGAVPLWALVVEMKFTAGESELRRALGRVVELCRK
jgi:tetraacyldisaccharide 4'-kinase